MPVNLYGGFAVFGFAVKMVPMKADEAAQRNAYFGLSGVELIGGGARGGTTAVSGRISGQTVGDLMDARFTLDAMANNVARDFYDSAGNYWAQAVMHPPKFEPRWTPGILGFQWKYELEIEHLLWA